MMKMCVWYSDTARGSHDSAAKTTTAQAIRRARGDIASGAQERVAHDGVELVGEVVARALPPHLASLDHVEVVGDLHRLVDVLVHEENGHALVPHGEELGVDLLHDARSEPGRGLVHEEQRGLCHQLLGEGQHLGLAARERGGATAALLAEARESRIGALEPPGHPLPVPPDHPAAELEILLNGELGKDVGALRDVADAEALDLVGGEGRDGAAVEADGTAPGVQEAEDRLEERRLPRPVGPDDPGDGARLHFEGDVAEDVDALDVACRHVLELETRHQVPRYASRTTGSLATSSRVPSAMRRPSSITVTRWQRRRSSAISWETMRKVTDSSRFMRRMASMMMSRMVGCTPAKGSSMRRTWSGWTMRARAICTSMLCPPESSRAWACRIRSRVTKSRSRRPRSRMSASGVVLPRSMAASAGRSTFSSTVMWPKSFEIWKVRATPHAVIWCARSRSVRWPQRWISPPSGR